MRTVIQIITLSLMLSFHMHKACDAYDNTYTHQYINSKALDRSKVDDILRNFLRFPKGVEEKVSKMEIQEWIADGGREEDEPHWRCLRHFHDPLEGDWDDSGLLSSYNTMIYWAQTPDPENEYSLFNEYSWMLAKEYYNQALITGSDEFYAKTFRALGQLMHLVSDAALPAHVRNDPHPIIDPYERWVKDNSDKIENIEYNSFSVGNTIFDKAVFSSSAPIPISSLWDHDEYKTDGSNIPDGANYTIGLAEYTNANFWTEDTFNDYPHPCLADTNFDENVWLNPELVIAEDKEVDNRIYFSKTTGDLVEHFLGVGYWYYQLYLWNKPEIIYSTILDEICFEDFAEKLIPRAIGYSAALLDYFFRGNLDVDNVTIRGDDYWISGLDLEVKNTTLMADGSTVEEFKNGSMSLAYKYSIPGDTEPIFGFAPGIYEVDDFYDPINDNFVSVSVSFPEDGYIPPEAINVSFTLVFKGRLGNEDNAVVAKVFQKPSWIAYSYRPDGWPNPSHIYTVLPDGSDSRKITSDGLDLEYFFSPGWGPHGMLLAFESEYDSCLREPECYHHPREIVVVDLTSGYIVKRLTVNDESHDHPIHTLIHPSFSPDGSQLAAAAIGMGTGESDFYALVIFDVETGNWNYINGYGYWDRGSLRVNESAIGWSPLGDKIAYAIADSYDSENFNIHTIRPDGTGDVKLTNGNYDDGDPSWSPDGEQIVFISDRDGGEYLDIWIMDKDGQNMKKIINCGSGCNRPNFSPDGSEIVFSGGKKVYKADSNGNNIRLFRDYSEIPAWSR